MAETSVITVTCEECGKTLHLRDRTAGKRGKSPTCGAMIEIPGKSGYNPPTYSSESLANLPSVMVLVEDITLQAQEDGLHKEIVKADVEEQLLSAWIDVLSKEECEKSPGGPYVYVNVLAMKRPKGFYIYHVRLELVQEVKIGRLGLRQYAATWSAMAILGASGQNGMADAVRKIVRDQVKEFLRAHSVVNPANI